MEPTPQKKKSGRSCFLYGCLSLVVVVIAAVVVLYLGVRYYVNSSIQKYTETMPTKFEKITLTDEENKALQERVKNFNQDLQSTNHSAQISLDGRDLNALIAADKNLANVKDRVRVKIDGDELSCLISFPLDDMSNVPLLGGLRGHYLNATASVKVALENGALTTKITGASVKNLQIPAEVLAGIEKNPSWQQLQDKPEIKKLISKIDWLKITGGKVELGTGKPAP